MMTTVLILIGVLQGCTFIGYGIILLVLVKKLSDMSKSTKIMSPTLHGHHTSVHIYIYIYIYICQYQKFTVIQAYNVLDAKCFPVKSPSNYIPSAAPR